MNDSNPLTNILQHHKFPNTLMETLYFNTATHRGRQVHGVFFFRLYSLHSRIREQYFKYHQLMLTVSVNKTLPTSSTD